MKKTKQNKTKQNKTKQNKLGSFKSHQTCKSNNQCILLLYKFNNLSLVSVNLMHIYMLYIYVFITKMAVSVIKFSIGHRKRKIKIPKFLNS